MSHAPRHTGPHRSSQSPVYDRALRDGGPRAVSSYFPMERAFGKRAVGERAPLPGREERWVCVRPMVKFVGCLQNE